MIVLAFVESIDSEDFNIELRIRCLEFRLQYFEVPELGTTITSAGCPEVISRNLKHVVAR